ncbi:MAG: Na+/H+ antiporter NhaA [Elusimicrobia bacterium]|nr:MAG: Na+/H+ antiporter NhaA [Elusimicrobiota bacterium]
MPIPPPSSQSPSLPPEAWPPLHRLVHRAKRPLERFLHIEAASGIILLLCAVVALLWANAPGTNSYAALWQTPLGLRVGSLVLERSLAWVVNDVLMVLFFFVVGMEIRRELQYGELSEWRRALLPVAAALGGMLIPALLYLALAGAPSVRQGWGVPMATDIAFAVGVLTLLGPRVPPALRVLLLALAVIDDLGAILVIAIFYSSGIALSGLGIALLGLALIVLLQRLGIRSKLIYVVPGVVTWLGIYSAGIHPTIAGVCIGLLTPVRAWLGPQAFFRDLRERAEVLLVQDSQVEPQPDVAAQLRALDRARREARSPAEELIERLHPWVAFVIMPLFALANAGVSLRGLAWIDGSQQVVMGIGAGLVLGKLIGVLLACALLLHLRLASLPRGLSLRHLIVLGGVAGIGFTMSLFTAQLAFPAGALLEAAKLGVLAASACAGVASLICGRLILPAAVDAGQAKTADEAEASTEQ